MLQVHGLALKRLIIASLTSEVRDVGKRRPYLPVYRLTGNMGLAEFAARWPRTRFDS